MVAAVATVTICPFTFSRNVSVTRTLPPDRQPPVKGLDCPLVNPHDVANGMPSASHTVCGVIDGTNLADTGFVSD